MVFCNTCAMEVEVEVDDQNGFSCCIQCGRVVEDAAFSNDVQFSKGADGEGGMVGQFVGGDGGGSLARYSGGRLWSGQSESHEHVAARGRAELTSLVEHFRIGPSGEMIEASHRLYRLALQRGFTRGRRVNQVAAMCLYIVCRQDRKPYMLIDFSDHLSVNLFALGSVYLQLMKLFRLEDHPAFTRPIDPSMYMHRFVDRLRFPDKAQAVTSTALKLVQSMKRDWLQTGRRPSGICGAALFVASHVHGFQRTKQDIVGVVHIGWSTIELRLKELAHTSIGNLTAAQFANVDLDAPTNKLLLEMHERAASPTQLALPAPPTGDASTSADAASNRDPMVGEGTEEGAIVAVDEEDDGWVEGCEHVQYGEQIFAHNMCRACYQEYLVVSGGVVEGSFDPPAYRRGLQRDIKRAFVKGKKAEDAAKAATEGAAEAEEAAAHGGGGVIGLLEAPSVGGDGGSDGASGSGEGQDANPAKRQKRASGADGGDDGVQGNHGSWAASRSDYERAGGGMLHPADLGMQDPLDPEMAEKEQALLLAQMADSGKGSGNSVGDRSQSPPALSAPQQQQHEKSVRFAADGPGGAAAADGSQAQQGADSGRQSKSPSPSPRVGMSAAEQAEAMIAARAAKRAAEKAAAAAAKAGASGAAAAGHPDSSTGPTQSYGAAGPAAATAAYDDSGRLDVEDEGAGGELVDDSMALALVPEEPPDTLSDIDDAELDAYLATSEEAEMKCKLWEEMNKDWIAKQAAKAAAEMELAEGPEGEAIMRRRQKRSYIKRQKILPPADNAADAARSMLEAKKLSNKINYDVFSNLFSTTPAEDAAAGGGAGGNTGDNEPTGASDNNGGGPELWDGGGSAVGGRSSGGGGNGTRSGAHAAGAGGYGASVGRAEEPSPAAAVAPEAAPVIPDVWASLGPSTAGGGGGRTAIGDVMKKRAAAARLVGNKEAEKYARMLEEDNRRRAGGLGGSFLSNLSSANSGGGVGAEGGGGAGRAGPAGGKVGGRVRLGGL